MGRDSADPHRPLHPQYNQFLGVAKLFRQKQCTYTSSLLLGIGAYCMPGLASAEVFYLFRGTDMELKEIREIES